MTLLQFMMALAGITASLSLTMMCAWLIQQRTGNSGWVDTIWTFGVGVVGLSSALIPLSGGEPHTRQKIVAALAAIWMLRLGVHIGLRSAGISDDPRYAKMSKDWGDNAPRQMFIFLQQQAFVSVALALPMFVAAHNPAPVRVWDVLAIVIMLVAVLGEGLSDWQLTRFKSDPANKHRVQRPRPVELVAPPELFLRDARLARLSVACDRFVLFMGLARARRPRLDVLASDVCVRCPAAGRTHAANAGRCISCLSAANQCVLSHSAARLRIFTSRAWRSASWRPYIRSPTRARTQKFPRGHR